MCKRADLNVDASKSEPSALPKYKAKLCLIQRHKAWCKRKADDKDGYASWRPAKRHRVSAKHWLMNVDNQVQHVF